MMTMQQVTSLQPADALERIEAYFGPDGQGMSVISRAPCRVHFKQGHAFIVARADPLAELPGCRVRLHGQGSEQDVLNFLSSLPDRVVYPKACQMEPPTTG